MKPLEASSGYFDLSGTLKDNPQIDRIQKFVNTISPTSFETDRQINKAIFKQLTQNFTVDELDARSLSGFFLPTILLRVRRLPAKSVLVIKQNFKPRPLLILLNKLGFIFFTQKKRPDLYEVHLARKNDLIMMAKLQGIPLALLRMEFRSLDVRKENGNILKKVLQAISQLPAQYGLKLIQSFNPLPLITVLESHGLKHYTQQINENEFHIYLFKATLFSPVKETKNRKKSAPSILTTKKIPVVIQSATPVVYPILLALIESKGIKKHFEIKEVKVWSETEKHLGWIVNGKADISFSAIIASANLLGKEIDVKLATVNVWDNFYLLSRGIKVQKISDLKGKKIYLPLFRKAPPAQVTRYLFRQFGENPDDYLFEFGDPFGRPEEIAQQLIAGQIELALLREPEVSYVLQADPQIEVAFSYSELWKQLNPQSFGLPNAGLVIKGSLIREHPDLVKMFLHKLEQASSWVQQNTHQAATMMQKATGRSLSEIQLFLQRVRFENVPAFRVKNEIKDYLKILEKKSAQRIITHAEELFLDESFF